MQRVRAWVGGTVGDRALRRGLVGAAGAAVALLVLAVLLAAMLQAGGLRDPFIRFVGRHLARSIVVKGDLHVHLLGLHPWVSADGVTIGNPPWMPPGNMGEIAHLALVIGLPGIKRPFTIDQLVLEGAALTLQRSASGFANWQWTDPRLTGDSVMPLIHGVSAPAAHLKLKDEVRHLDFEGTVSIDEPMPATRLRIDGSGELNGHPVRVTLDGDPLAAAEPASPYRFAFTEQSSGTTISGRGALPQPFDTQLIDATFDASGADLRDLYFLTGVKLLGTGAYRLTGNVARRGLRTEFSELTVLTGQSEVHGRVTIDSSTPRPMFHVDLDAPRLRLADLGARASSREPGNASPVRFLLSEAAIDPTGWRHDDAVATLHASRLDIGLLPVRDFAAAIDLSHGVLTAHDATGRLFDGALTAHARIDLNEDEPVDGVDLQIAGLHLGEYLPKGKTKPNADGLLRARISASGHGRSLHDFASTADGSLSVAVSQGEISAALIDMAALDLSALGLSFDKHNSATRTRCGVAGFRAQAGVLTAQVLLLDTAAALIEGAGTIRMDSEALDLTLHGHPKSPQLFKVRSPVTVRGTLLDPSFAIAPGKAVEQMAAAVALGVLLTPLASMLAFLDPGLAKDADCAALLAQKAAPAR